jgi:NADH:ubiquinone oxidoreductase subunit
LHSRETRSSSFAASANIPVGTDSFGNRYFENYNGHEEVPGRHRWVDYAQDDFNASQVPPGWYSWLSHIRLTPPPEDPVFQASKQPWMVPYTENL